MDIRKRLESMADTGNGDFVARLIPTIPREQILGTRTPDLRAFAKEVEKNPQARQAFLGQLPHHYLEENHLHGFLLEREKDLDKALQMVEAFLPHVDNWATCDTFSPKVFKKHAQRVYPYVLKWLDSGHTYTVRYAMGLLMGNYLEEDFTADMPALVARVQSEEYYVRMMQAWYLATALYKQWDGALPILLEEKLPVWTHNKAIQKAVESRRITTEQKEYLRTLKRK